MQWALPSEQAARAVVCSLSEQGKLQKYSRTARPPAHPPALPAPQGLDIGPKSIEDFQKKLGDCKTVIWNGPMGVFEFDAFAKVGGRVQGSGWRWWVGVCGWCGWEALPGRRGVAVPTCSPLSRSMWGERD